MIYYCGGFTDFKTMQIGLSAITDSTVIMLGLNTEQQNYMQYKTFLSNISLDNNLSIYVCRGLYDNPKWFKNNQDFAVNLVTDYSVMTVDNVRTLFIGGGHAADRSVRIKDYSYFDPAEYTKEIGYALFYDIEKIGRIVSIFPPSNLNVTIPEEYLFWRNNDPKIITDYWEYREHLQHVADSFSGEWIFFNKKNALDYDKDINYSGFCYNSILRG